MICNGHRKREKPIQKQARKETDLVTIPQPQNVDTRVLDFEENVVDGRMGVGSKKDRFPFLDQSFENLGDRRRFSRSGHSKNEGVILRGKDLGDGSNLIRIQVRRSQLFDGSTSNGVESRRLEIYDQSTTLFIAPNDEKLDKVVPDPPHPSGEFVFVDPKYEFRSFDPRLSSCSLRIVDEGMIETENDVVRSHLEDKPPSDGEHRRRFERNNHGVVEGDVATEKGSSSALAARSLSRRRSGEFKSIREAMDFRAGFVWGRLISFVDDHVGDASGFKKKRVVG